jgi:hypothetical protein
MWDQYSDRELQCFLCDSVDCQPIFAQILPDLPTRQANNHARTGKTITFQFNRPVRHHPL